MPQAVDWAQVVRDLKRHVTTKPNHGARELLEVIARLEVLNEVDLTQYERFLARFGDEIADAVLGSGDPASADPITTDAASSEAMADTSPPSTAHEGAKETTCRTTRRQQSPPPSQPLPSSSGRRPRKAVRSDIPRQSAPTVPALN